jgi:FtsH ternary system domain X5
MSRAYRIQVRESITRTLTGEDEISTQLEILEVLPPEAMAGLLTEELKNRGFEEKDGKLVRTGDDTTVTVDPNTGAITIKAKTQQTVDLEGTREGISYDDVGPAGKAVKQNLQKELQKDLEKRAEQKAGELQTKATEKLQKELCELEQEMAGVVNRVTIEALKEKAKQLGEIKEISEDAEAGSLSIKLEV